MYFLKTYEQKIMLKISILKNGEKVVPFSREEEKKKGIGFRYNGAEFITHTRLKMKENAFFSFNFSQKIILLCFLIMLFFGIGIDWHTTIMALIAAVTVLYFIDLLFNIFLIYRSFSQSSQITVKKKEMRKIKESAWPKYTVFCPLYKEWEVLPQFVTAITQLDYPKDKLQVLLLLEENDQKTIEKATSLNLPKYFQIIIVPHSLPKTKPKALNFGMRFAQGEYAVIYDAEDIPEKDQLKKAYLAFRKTDKRVVCVQAKLNYYNPHQNLLTRLFTAEYSLWFDLILPGLQSINAPIPLGGTSNHFRLNDLKKLKGWDPFNVTEDCDLGIRLAKRGYRTTIVDSSTFEEANSHPLNWLRQRSRWIKGYLQTYFIHMRSPKDFVFSLKEPDILTFQLIVGGKVLSMFLNPFMWLTTVTYFVFRPWVGAFIESFYPPPIMYMGFFCLIFGNFLYLYCYMIGCVRRKYYDLVKYVFLIPLYWLGMSLAGWKALYELVKKPHYWAKTVHGYHINNKKATSQASKIVGGRLVDIKAIYSEREAVT